MASGSHLASGKKEEELALALKGPFLAPTAKGRGCNSLSLLFFCQEGKKGGECKGSLLSFSAIFFC